MLRVMLDKIKQIFLQAKVFNRVKIIVVREISRHSSNLALVCEPRTHILLTNLSRPSSSLSTVYHGNMLHLRDHPKVGFTEINVNIKKVVRQSLLSELPSGDNSISHYSEEASPSWSFGPDASLPTDENRTNIYISDKCQVRIGYEDFLFMINSKLGYNIIKCAPRYQQWVDLVKNNSVYKHCMLST